MVQCIRRRTLVEKGHEVRVNRVIDVFGYRSIQSRVCLKQLTRTVHNFDDGLLVSVEGLVVKHERLDVYDVRGVEGVECFERHGVCVYICNGRINRGGYGDVRHRGWHYYKLKDFNLKNKKVIVDIMKGPTVSPALLALSKLVQNQGSEDDELYRLGRTLERMFEEKRLTRMWIDFVTNQVHCE